MTVEDQTAWAATSTEMAAEAPNRDTASSKRSKVSNRKQIQEKPFPHETTDDSIWPPRLRDENPQQTLVCV